MIDIAVTTKTPNSEKVNGSQRLAVLKEYHVLDGTAEQVYDDITELAMHICGAAVSVISLKEGSRQWFKSKWKSPDVNAAAKPWLSLCRNHRRQSETLVVRDTKKDKQFSQSRFVNQAPRIRFFAGFPLKDSAGATLGRLSVMDLRPRSLTLTQQRVMRVLARKAAMIVELRRVSAHLADALEHVKTLRQLIPICAWCKRIRDDDGYWSQVEAYFHAQVFADFTHSICPTCLEKERAKLQRRRSAQTPP